jgi:hypothetical protein
MFSTQPLSEPRFPASVGRRHGGDAARGGVEDDHGGRSQLQIHVPPFNVLFCEDWQDEGSGEEPESDGFRDLGGTEEFDDAICLAERERVRIGREVKVGNWPNGFIVITDDEGRRVAERIPVQSMTAGAA